MAKTATFNPILAQASTEYASTTEGFIASALFPNFPTQVQAGEFPIFLKENLLNVPEINARAPGTSYPLLTLETGKGKFATQDFGLGIPMDDREKAIYASIFNAEVGSVQTQTRHLLVNKEFRAKKLIDASNIPSSVPTVKWDDSTANLIKEVATVRQVIKENCGMLPNLMTISRTIWNFIQNNAGIIDRVKHTSAGSITTQMIANLFEVGEIKIADEVTNEANEGQALSISSIWGDNIIFAYVSPTLSLQSPTLGRTFSWTKGVSKNSGQFGVFTRREDGAHSDIHEMCHDVEENIVSSACAYILKDVLT